MRIDAHISLWNQPPASARNHPRFPGDNRAFLPEHIEPILSRNRFDGAIVFTSGDEPDEVVRLTAWCNTSSALRGIAARWPESDPVANAANRNGALPEQFTAAHTAGILRGLWLPVDSPALSAAACCCLQYGLALDLLPVAQGFPIDHLLALVETHPQLPIVLSHAAAPPLANQKLTSWMHDVRQLAAKPNVHYKCSALWSSGLDAWNLATLQSLFAFVFETFGERRVLFGSDWPYSLPEHAWKESLARFTQAMGPRQMDFREEVLGNVAARVYGLRPSDQRSIDS